MWETGTFPATYAAVETDLLLRAYAESPARVRRALEGLTPEELRANPRSAGKWSIAQIVVHLADAEIMGAARARQTYTGSGRELAFYDQDVWARELGYGEAGDERVAGSLALFAALRETTLPLFRDAEDADWAKTGLHAELGPLTLRQLLELYADHGERHLEQILEIRRLLGRPLECPLLLPQRLY